MFGWIARSWRRGSGEPTSWHIKLDDSFHRTKRTVLLYLSGCLLLSLAEGTSAVKTPGLDLELDRVALWWLVALAAGYYLWGFVHEVRMALAANGELASQQSADTVSVAAEKLAKQINATSEFLAQQRDRITTESTGLANFEKRVPEVPNLSIALREIWDQNPIRDNFPANFDSALEVTERSLTNTTNNWGERMQSSLEMCRGDLGEQSQTLQHIDRRLSENLSILNATAATVTALDQGIHVSTRRHFVRWEFGSVVAMAGFVILFGAPEIAAGLHRTTGLFELAIEHGSDVICALKTGANECNRLPSASVPIRR